MPDNTILLLDDLPHNPDIDPAAGDSFGFARLAAPIADSLWDGAGPYAVHVSGPWGSGKTSFCRILRRELFLRQQLEPAPQNERGSLCKRLIWVDFVATQFEQAGRAETSLMLKIRDALSLDRLKAQTQTAPTDGEGGGAKNDPFWHDLVQAREDLGFLNHHKVENREYDIVKAMESVGRFERILEEELSPIFFGDPEQYAVLERRIVVCIDDLDRCRPEYVTEILESIQRFVSTKRIFFVISSDREVLLEAYRNYLRRMERSADISAERALEKYIRTTIILPGIEVAEDFSSALERIWAGNPFQRNLLNIYFDVDGVMEPKSVAALLCDNLGNAASPRTIKRIINDLLLRFRARIASDKSLSTAYESQPPAIDVLKSDPGWRDYSAYCLEQIFHVALEHVWPEAVRLGNERDSARAMCRLLAFRNLSTGDWTKEQISQFLLGRSDVCIPRLRDLEGLQKLALQLDANNHLSGRCGRPWSDHRTPFKANVKEYAKRTEKNAPGIARTDTFASEVKKYADEQYLDTSENDYRSMKEDGYDGRVIETDGIHDGGEDRIKKPTSEQLRQQLRLIELQVDNPATPERDIKHLMSEAVEIIEKYHDEIDGIIAGNLAVSAEVKGLRNIAWRIYKVARDDKWISNDFSIASQYISFLLDYKGSQLPETDDVAGSDSPPVVAEWWLNYFNDKDIGDRKDRYERLKLQLLGIKVARGEEVAREQAKKLMEERLAAFSDRQSVEAAAALLLTHKATADLMPDALDTLYDIVKEKVLGSSTPQRRLVRMVADGLASSKTEEHGQKAIELYQTLKDTEYWNADTKHNLATMLFRFAQGSRHQEAERLWREAYKENPGDPSIRQAFSQYLQRTERIQDALRVMRGENL